MNVTTTSSNDILHLPPEASLDELLAMAGERYPVHFEPVKIGNHSLEVLQISNLEDHIEQIVGQSSGEVPAELPFWVKLWRSSFLLAYFLEKLPSEGKTLLEIGAGVGLCGLMAAKLGFETVITDINPDAYLFTRINILKNGLQEKAEARQADFTTYRFGKRFDYIIGSEVLYHEKNYRPLIKFLLAHTANTPQAEIIIGKEYCRKATKFFNLANKEFHVDKRDIGMKTDDAQTGAGNRHITTLCRMKARKNG